MFAPFLGPVRKITGRRLRPQDHYRLWLRGLAEYEGFQPGRVGPRDCEEFARWLFEGNARVVVVTLGVRGAWMRQRGSPPLDAPAFEANVVDTTGAVDIFHGAFTYAVAPGWDVAPAVTFATAAGALACTALGGRGTAPSRQDVQRLLETRR